MHSITSPRSLLKTLNRLLYRLLQYQTRYWPPHRVQPLNRHLQSPNRFLVICCPPICNIPTWTQTYHIESLAKVHILELFLHLEDAILSDLPVFLDSFILQSCLPGIPPTHFLHTSHCLPHSSQDLELQYYMVTKAEAATAYYKIQNGAQPRTDQIDKSYLSHNSCC